jgi:hypothetical protein
MSLRRIVALALTAASCSRRLEAPVVDGANSEAVDALVGAYCISDVQTDDLTYHFDSPRFVLQAAEGLGPRVLALTVAGFAAPLISTTVSARPNEADVSAAVGYSIGEYHYVQASAAYSVDQDSYKRLEAYINYARSAWIIRDASCGAVVGTGESFKPIGIYFAFRDTPSAAIPVSSVVNVLPVCTPAPCAIAPSTPPDTSHAGAVADGGGS